MLITEVLMEMEQLTSTLVVVSPVVLQTRTFKICQCFYELLLPPLGAPGATYPVLYDDIMS